MIAEPYYSWDLKHNINNDNMMIIIQVDIDMLERIKSIMRIYIQDLANSGKYEDLRDTTDIYLKLEKLSIAYYSRKEEQNNDVLPEDSKQ